ALNQGISGIKHTGKEIEPGINGYCMVVDVGDGTREGERDIDQRRLRGSPREGERDRDQW
ncbi:hypothetical protein U1Q18_038111, partial [Sarracenia purpurea var. burkii]